MQIIGQIAGMCAVAISIFLYIYADKRRTLVLKLIADLLWVVHFFMLGCYTAMLTTAIAIVREILLIKNIRSKAIVIVFPILFFASLLVTYSSPISFLPPIASTFFTIGLWSKSINRKEVAFSSSLMLAYGLYNTSYATIINEIFTLTSLVIGVIKIKRMTSMISDENKQWAISLLQQKQAALGRLPKKDDFDEVTRSRIKAYLGPWPRALEAAGLKEPKKRSGKAESRSQR